MTGRVGSGERRNQGEILPYGEMVAMGDPKQNMRRK